MRGRFRLDRGSAGLLALLVLIAASFAVAACGDDDTASAGDAPAGGSAAAVSKLSNESSVKVGESLFRKECQSCHGTEGERLPVAPLQSVEFLNSRGDATLLAVVSEGKGTMPAFGKARGGPFSEDQVRAVVAFINSKAGRSSTTLLAGQGAERYGAVCSSCHGPAGDRIPIAPLDAQGFLDSRTDAQLQETLLKGTGAMRGLEGRGRDQISEQDATAIISYLRYRVQAQTVKSVSQGRDLYVGNCLACHGAAGDRVKDVNLSAPAFLTGKGDGSIISAIARGTKTGPAFGTEAGGGFTVQDTAALIAYLKSWSGLSATSALSSAALSGLAGESIFVQNCSACHGATGDQVAGVQLKSPTFLSQQGREVVRRTIENGNKKGMPAWSKKSGGPLDDDQITSLVEFLFRVVEGQDQAAAPAGGGAGGGSAKPSPFPNGQSASDFFGARCAGCHGADRKGLVGPALLPDRLTQPNDVYVETILSGRPGTPMPAWGQQGVTKDMATALVEFLKTPPGGAASAAPAGTAPAAPSGGASAGGSSAGAGANAADSKIFDGKPPSDFFASKCAACHGADRKGLIGPALLPDRLTQPDQVYVDTILKGRPGTPMPAWGQQGVTAEQAAAMVRFLKTPPGSASAAPAAGGGGGTSIALTAEQSTLFGKELFESTCAMCHGKDGMQVQQCPIGSRLFLMNMSQEGLITRISRGKPPRMPTWAKRYGGPLSDEQILSVAAYLGTMAN